MTQNTSAPWRPHRSLSVAACAFSLFAGSVYAQPTALVQGGGVSIIPPDMVADSMRMPPEMRDLVLSDVRKVSQIAENLYVRRVLAQRALEQGIDKEPDTAAAVNVARDKVLSDRLLVKMDEKHMPDEDAVEKMARAMYKASPERFMSNERVHVRHILLSKQGDTARADAEDVLKQLKNGADFAALAKEHSKDPGSAAKGGDLGTFEHGKMVPEFDKVAFAMTKPNELSELVETKFGYHILQLVQKIPAGQQPYADVHDALVQEVRGKAVQEARMKEVQKILATATPNSTAIEAFASQYKPTRKPTPAQ